MTGTATPTAADVVRRIPVGSTDLDGTLRPVAMLGGDPTVGRRPGRLVRATHTPDGPASLVATWTPGDGEAEVRTWGPGAGWLADRAEGLLGRHDDPTGFDPVDSTVARLWQRHRRLRLTRTATVWHDATWLVVQQRVRGTDAARQWRALVRRLGTPAPGVPGLLLPPTADRLADVAYHELHRLGIERRRADALRSTARVAAQLERLVDEPARCLTRLRAVPGIGPWTTSLVSAITFGDADAVILGDSGIPSLVTWTLAGERWGDDARMQELLAPHAPHRYRVLRLISAGGRSPARRRAHLPRNDITDR